MKVPDRWDIDEVMARLPLLPWEGTVWRTHWRDVHPADWSLSFRISGRYHRGLDLFPEEDTWLALYTSLRPEIAVWEMVRQRVAHGALTFLANNCLSQLRVQMPAVVDFTVPERAGLHSQDLVGEDRSYTQALAAAVLQRGGTGILAPSAAMKGTNLIVLPAHLPSDWSVDVITTVPLPLDLPRSLQ